MDLLFAVAKWRTCEWGDKNKCRGENKCVNYMYVDPRNLKEGPGPSGQRTLCSLLEDLNKQVISKTEND
jgi:hypothetical protein